MLFYKKNRVSALFGFEGVSLIFGKGKKREEEKEERYQKVEMSTAVAAATVNITGKFGLFLSKNTVYKINVLILSLTSAVGVW